jgi:hypothetical protein
MFGGVALTAARISALLKEPALRLPAKARTLICLSIKEHALVRMAGGFKATLYFKKQ